MSRPLNLLLLGNEEIAVGLRKSFSKVYVVSSPRELVRSLIDRTIDLVVVEKGTMGMEKVRKVFRHYACPFFVLHEGSLPDDDEYGIYHVGIKEIFKKLELLEFEIRNIKFRRRNSELLDLLDSVKNFEIAIDNIEKDVLIPQVNKYFEDKLNVQRPYWIEVQSPNGHLPPILQCKQELLQQEVNHSSLIKDLDSCEVEVISTPQFQVWKQQKGTYLAIIWLKSGGTRAQCVLLNDIRFISTKGLKNLLDYLVPILSRRWELCQVVEKAQIEVFQDSLTSLYNQRYLDQVLTQKMHEQKRYKTPFTILFIDVDHFKKVNDSMGHIVGSAVLVELGTLLGDCIRNTDYAFRYGGDEFIILLGHTEGEQAELVAERIRYKVEQANFAVHDQNVKITVSIGLASYPKHAGSAEEIIQIADEAMYYGKNKSRNIVYKAS